MGSSIRIRDLIKVYREGGVEVQALRGVNLDIGSGEIVVIMGPSGSGKTTLLNIIGGLDKPSSGSVVVDGIDLATLNDNELTLYRRGKVGYVFQFFNLIPTLTAVENVELSLYLRGIRGIEARRRALHFLELVGLSDLGERFPSRLSGGQQQRVAIARALAKESSVLLADEPTGNLDSSNARLVLDVLRETSKRLGVTTIIASHNPLVSSIADVVVYIEDGVIKNISKINKKGE